MAGTQKKTTAPERPVPDAQATRRVCHRVKNDLQTILNLLILAQARANTIEDLSEAMQKRITVVGSAYAMIADSGKTPLLDSLAKEIARRCASRYGVEINITANTIDVNLHLRLCTPFALWIGEIVDNSVVHGQIGADVRLDIDGGRNSDELWLRILDNGQGLPLNFDPDTDAGLGLQLAKAIAQRDLGGDMQLDNTPHGLAARLIVPVDEFARLNSD